MTTVTLPLADVLALIAEAEDHAAHRPPGRFGPYRAIAAEVVRELLADEATVALLTIEAEERSR